MPATTTLKVTFVSESAAYENTFGWYNSVTGEGGILFADVETQGYHAPLTNGATTTFTVNTADLPNIQYFLIPNGANDNPPDDLTGAIKVIQLSDGSWAVADVDSHGNVIYVHGHPDLVEGTGANALFTETSKNAGGVDYASSVAGTHQTSATLAGDTADGPTGTIAWEDQVALRHGHNAGVPGDADYNDAVFNITLLNTPPETNNAAASGNEDTTIAVTLTGTDIDGTVTSFRITSLPANGTLYSDAALTHVIAVNGTVTASGNAATVYFVPNANFNGGSAFQFASIDNGGLQDSTPATAAITVNPVNDAPSGADHTVTALEDGSYTFATSDFGFSDPNDTPANSLQAVEITTLPGAGTLTDNGVAVTAGQFVSAADIAAGLLKFAPAANGNGGAYANFTFQVQDNGGTANGGVDLDQSPNTISVNVTSVNDAPAGTDTTVHTGAVYVFSTADFGFSDPNDSPPNNFAAVEITTLPASGTLTLNGNAVNAGDLISVADINGGHLQFTAAGGASASFTFQVQDDGGTANGGVNLDQSPNTFTLVVNTPPVANDDSVAATEAGGLNNAVPGHDPSGNVVLGTGDAGAVQDTDAQDPSAALTVVATGTGVEGSADNGTVGTAFSGAHGALLLGSNGSYSYAVNQNDAAVQALHTAADTITDIFHYTVQDSGGLTDQATLTITIHGANDLPQAVADSGSMSEDDGPTSFNVTANDTLDPDSTAANTISVGPVTVTGPAGETFVNTDATATVVANQIQVALNNANFQQLALGEHATVTVPYTLTGDAGDTSNANLVVTVNGVNDVPVAFDDGGTMTEDQGATAFTVLGNDTLDPDHGAPNNVTAGAVSNVSAPSGEGIDASDVIVSVNGSNQIVVTLGSDFQHLGDGETASFDVGYTLHGDQPGDLANATLHVTVTGANDAPTAHNVTFAGASSANYNTDLVVNDPTDGAPTTIGPFKGITASLLSLSGASDADGPNPLSFTPLNNVLTADGGHVTLQADGDFIYTPKVGTTATTDSFTFTVTDGNSGPSGPGTATATATITLQGPHIWYVNADGPDGDGSSEHPFSTLTHFAGAGGVDHAGDIIFLESASGHYTGGITLENNEQLISQSAGLVVPDGGGGAGTVTLQAAGGANVVVDGGVVLGSGNNIQGVDFGSTAGFALSGVNVGTVHVNDVTQGVINNGIGGGVSIGGASNVLNMDFGSVTTGGGTNGITLTNTSGTFHAHGGTISGAGGPDVNLNGGTLAFTLDGAISDATGQLVVIQNMSGGAQSFTGNVTDTGAGTGGGILLSSNTGATLSFSGGMTLSTGGNTAFTASSGGTINVTGTNHLTTTTGTALKISDTTIGASNVTFHDISSNGASSGIILFNTGTSGGLIVTGDAGSAVNASGGTIANSTGVGISLTSTKGVSLDQMTVSNGGNDGINGSGVTNFTLTNSTISGNGNAVGENGIEFSQLTGDALISGTTVHNSFSDNLKIANTSGTLNTLNIKNDTFDHSAIQSSPAGGNGVSIDLQGSAVLTDGSISNSTFSKNFSNGILVNTSNSAIVGVDNATSSSTHGFVVSGNQFHDNNIAIQFGVSGASDLTTDIQNNTIVNPTRDAPFGTNGTSDAIVVGSSSTTLSGSTLNARIDGNTIGDATIEGSGSSFGDGIRAIVQGLTDATILINNNTIREAPQGFGIDVESLGSASGTPPTSDVTITNNNVDHVDTAFGGGSGAFPLPAIYVAGDNQGTAGPLQLDITGNTVPDIDGSHPSTFNFTGAYLEVVEFEGPDGILRLVDNGPASVDAQSELQENNTGSIATAGGTIDLISGPINTPPDLSPLPLLAAQGEGPGAAATLTLEQLAPIVQEALQRWEAAGLSQQQATAVAGLQFGIANLGGGELGQEINHGRIVIDDNGAGWGWFVDPTPAGDDEFGNVHSSTEAGATSADAAGKMDLLTVVMHEIGHAIGLDDSTTPGTVMSDEIDTGLRRLPVAADVAAAHGDTFDFSALTQTNVPSGLAAALAAGDLRVAEDAGGTFATLQIHDGTGASDWLSVAQLDGVQAGDAVNVAFDAAHVAHLHAVLLA